MSRLRLITKGISRRIICGIVIGAIVCGGIFVKPKTSHAILGGFGGELVAVIGGTGTIQDTISAAANTITSGIQQALQIKEFALDDIAFKIAKKVLADSTASLVDWINSGFEGRPAFITNLNDYLLNATDEVMGDFLSESNFAALCEPLRVPVQVIVEDYYVKSRNWDSQSQCTLTGSAADLQEFVEGNFDKGGWPQWFRMVSQPQNNIYGAAAIGITRGRDTAVNAKVNAERESDWSNGWLSVKDCSAGKCITVTPGNVISEYLNFKLTIGDRTLIEADEINEVVGALFSQLGNQAIAGVGGLLGMSYSSDGSSSPYLQQMTDQAAEVAGNAGGDATFLEDAIRVETQYKAIHEKALEDVTEIVSELESCTAPGAEKLLEDAEELQTNYQIEVLTADLVIGLLNEFVVMYNTPDVVAKQTVTEQFLAMKRDGDVLHELSDVELAKQSISGEVVDLQTKAEQCTE